MLGDAVLQDAWRDVAEVAGRDGEDGIAHEGVGLGQRKDRVAARHVEYLGPVAVEVLHEMDARSAVRRTGRGEGDDGDGTEECESARADQILWRIRAA